MMKGVDRQRRPALDDRGDCSYCGANGLLTDHKLTGMIPGMRRSLLVVFLGLMMVRCSGSDGSSTTEEGSMGSTSSETGGTTGATTDGTGATTGATSMTSMTSVTSSSSSTTGPSPTSIGDDSMGGDSMTNGDPPPNVQCGELPPGVVGVPYSTFVYASGGSPPYSWGLAAGAPAWLTLTDDGSESAELTGVPPEAGVYKFNLEVFSVNSEENASPACTLVIAEAVSPGTNAVSRLPQTPTAP